MSVENVIRFGIETLRKYPKIALPNVLSWITSALMSAIIVLALGDVGSAIGATPLDQAIANEALLGSIISIAITYFIIALPVIALSFVINVFLFCVYSDIARQAHAGRGILVTKSFSAARGKLLPMTWTFVVGTALMLLVFSAVFALGLLGGALGIGISIITIAIIALLSLPFFYEIPAIVVLENKRGIEAVKRSFGMARGNLGPLYFVMLIIGIATGIVNSVVGGIPYAGAMLIYIVDIFLSAWALMTPVAFYYEYAKKA
jgi:hypothetical protein